MAQVVTSENMAEFIQTGKVEEFKPPEAKDPEVKASEEVKETPKGDDDLPDGVKAKVDKIIGKKHKEMKEAEEFGKAQYLEKLAAEKQAEQLKADRDALAERLAQYETKSRPATDQPKQSDFQTVEEYVDALADYKVELKIKQREEADKQRTADEKARQIQNEFAAKLDIAQKKYPDFHEVTESADFETPPHITQYLLEGGNGAELGYHLSKMFRDDPTELNRILNLPPIKAIAELGKLEARITEVKTEARIESKPEVKAEERPLSKAPQPITPIVGNGAGIQKDPSQMTFRELREYERNREAERRRRG